MFSYGNKVYISYSAATVDKFYTLGLMMADKGSDLMNPDSWTHVTYPLLSSYDTDEGKSAAELMWAAVTIPLFWIVWKPCSGISCKTVSGSSCGNERLRRTL